MNKTVAEIVAKAEETVTDLQGFVKTAKALSPTARAFADDVLEAYHVVAAREGKSVDELLTGNPRADRNRLETAELAEEMGRTIDWSEVPFEAFKLAKKAAQAWPVLAAAFA